MSITSGEIGRLGEKKAQIYLFKNGYKIIETNFHSRRGEIDIIAQKGDVIAFVEVKTRANNSLIDPVEAVDKTKAKKIIVTAQKYLTDKNIDLQPRFDVCEVMFNRFDMSFKVINYIKNAFSQEGDYAVF